MLSRMNEVESIGEQPKLAYLFEIRPLSCDNQRTLPSPRRPECRRLKSCSGLSSYHKLSCSTSATECSRRNREQNTCGRIKTFFGFAASKYWKEPLTHQDKKWNAWEILDHFLRMSSTLFYLVVEKQVAASGKWWSKGPTWHMIPISICVIHAQNDLEVDWELLIYPSRAYITMLLWISSDRNGNSRGNLLSLKAWKN